MTARLPIFTGTVPRGTGRRVLLFQLDGKIPNLALMRLSAFHRASGDVVQMRKAGNARSVQRELGEAAPDLVYGSLIFERTRPLAETLAREYPGVILGGTGWDRRLSLEDIGIESLGVDYSLYPRFEKSIGFTQRGCRLKCPFCVVPEKEGAMREEQTIADLWRGDPFPRELILLDNDFFGQPNWRERIAEIRSGGFKVSFNQGINARFLDDETAAAVASVDYRDDGMKTKRIYTAWDNRKDERRLFRGLEALARHGVRPGHMLVYILIGYWKGETHDDRDHRRRRLREFGAIPYPMPYTRTSELVSFQRWVIGAHDKNRSWAEWRSARNQPRNFINPAQVALL